MAEEKPAPEGLEQLPDDELVVLVTRRNKDALSALYDRHARLVFSLALRVVEERSFAEEITQDVFVTLWSKGASYRSERGHLSAWLLSIAHNRSIDELRKRRRNARLPTVEIDETQIVVSGNHDQVADTVLARLDRQSIREALEKLPTPQKQVIVLAYFQGLTQSEISQAVGAPLGTVKTRIRLGLQKLREFLPA